MANIVEKLRDYAKYEMRSDYELLEAAADEIERLRAALEEIDAACYAGDPVKAIAQRALMTIGESERRKALDELTAHEK